MTNAKKDTLRFLMTFDASNQWFVSVWVSKNDKMVLVRFKVDTGCNAVVLSHSTLYALGFISDSGELSKLPGITGALVSGDTHNFKKLGVFYLYKNVNRSIHVCDVQAICHATHETHDLLGILSRKAREDAELAK